MKNKKFVIIFILSLLIIDQVVKVWIKTNMTIGESIMVFGDWFQIKFIENKGAAYGFEFGGEMGKLFLSLVRIVMIGALVYYINKLLKHKTKIGVIIGLSLILCGALGNLFDSIFYGVLFSESTPWQVAQFLPEGGGYATWLHGSVVDMLYFPIYNTTLPDWFPFGAGEPYTFFSPIFNIADSYITIGAAYLILFNRNEIFK